MYYLINPFNVISNKVTKKITVTIIPARNPDKEEAITLPKCHLKLRFSLEIKLSFKSSILLKLVSNKFKSSLFFLLRLPYPLFYKYPWQSRPLR